MKGINKVLVSIGRGVGKVVGAMYQAGRDTIEQIMTNVLPFMAFISLIIGIILATGIGDWIANNLSPLAGSLLGLIVPVGHHRYPCSVTVVGTWRRYRSDHRHPAGYPVRNRCDPRTVRIARAVRHQPTGWL